jgi:hypothetical protein
VRHEQNMNMQIYAQTITIMERAKLEES